MAELQSTKGTCSCVFFFRFSSIILNSTSNIESSIRLLDIQLITIPAVDQPIKVINKSLLVDRTNINNRIVTNIGISRFRPDSNIFPVMYDYTRVILFRDNDVWIFLSVVFVSL